MTKKIKTSSIVFSGFQYGEANKIITLFSKEYGIIKTIAYGVKKLQNRFAGNLEFCNEVELILNTSEKGDLYTLSECNLLFSSHRIRENIETLGHLYYIVEFVTKIFQPSSENLEIYVEFIDMLKNINKLPNCSYSVSRYFQLRVLKILGYLPDLFECTRCHNNLRDEIYVTNRLGWFLCKSCANSKLDFLLSMNCSNFFKMASSLELCDFNEWNFNYLEMQELNKVFNLLVYSVINKKMITENFI